jgi:hypothetical protein
VDNFAQEGMDGYKMRRRTGLNDIEQSGAEFGLASLARVEHTLGEMLLQQRVAVGGCL